MSSGNLSNQPCYRCSATEAYWMPIDYRDSRSALMSICSNCPYMKCRGCSRMTTIEDSVSKCFCGDSEYCVNCKSGISVVVCPYCNEWSIEVCQKPECSKAVHEYFESYHELCSLCFKNFHCTHPRRGPISHDGVYCMHVSGKETGRWCEKWICPSCVEPSLVAGKGFMCAQHKNL